MTTRPTDPANAPAPAPAPARTPAVAAPLRFVGRIESTVDPAGRAEASHRIDPGHDPGEWEYVLVARVPAHDGLAAPSQAPLHVSAEGEKGCEAVVEVLRDPDDPNAWDDVVRLYSSEDEGASYRSDVRLRDGRNARESRPGVTEVTFRDVPVGTVCTCVLDMKLTATGKEEGELVIFERLRMPHVAPPIEAKPPGEPADECLGRARSRSRSRSRSSGRG